MKSRVTLALFAALSTFISGTLHAAEAKSSAAPGASDIAEGTTKQLPGGALLHLAPGTRIEMLRSLKLQLAAPGSPQTVTQVVKLISGRVDVDIPMSKTPKTAVLLQAPHKVSAVAKGGHSIAIVDANRVTIAAVDGDMLAASGNEWKTLPSGLVRGFVGADPSYQEQKVPGVPSVRIPQPLLLGLGSSPAALAEADGVKEADHYRFSVWRVSDNGNELLRQLDARGSAAIAGLKPGQYRVTARAVDASGIFGQESAGVALRVVGAELPVGARYEDGAILLGQRARAKLLGAAGLEASYNASQHFVTAPDSVGLSRGESTLLRLREPGTTQELRVALEPRSLRADVQITPKHPRWPEDMLEVTVQLFDARGRPVTESTTVKPTVLVDVEPVAVTWMRSDNTMHAFIPAPITRGPWVVRVEIADEFGDPAGRDFVEIAGPSRDRISAR